MSFVGKDTSWDNLCTQCKHTRRMHTTKVVDKDCFQCGCVKFIFSNLEYLEWKWEQSLSKIEEKLENAQIS